MELHSLSFAVAMMLFWICTIYVTLRLPHKILQLDGPVDQVVQFKRGSKRPRLLSVKSVDALKALRWPTSALCTVFGIVFVLCAIWSFQLLIDPAANGFGPRQLSGLLPPTDCLPGDTMEQLRIATAVLWAPAGVAMALVFDVLMTSQFVAVAIAGDSIEGLIRRLHNDRRYQGAGVASAHLKAMRLSLPEVAEAEAAEEEAMGTHKLSRSIARADDQEWDEKVKEPFMWLIRHTLPQLSKWGRVLGAQTSGCFAQTMLSVSFVAANQNLVAFFLMALAIIPLINLWGPAKVSSACMNLMETINEVWGDTQPKDMGRVFALIGYSSSANYGQGIGFVLVLPLCDIKVVLNRNMLVKLASMSLLLVPIIETMISLGSTGKAPGTEAALEQLQAEQAQILQEQALLETELHNVEAISLRHSQEVEAQQAQGIEEIEALLHNSSGSVGGGG